MKQSSPKQPQFGIHLRRVALRAPWLPFLLKALLVFVPFLVTCFCTLDLDFGWHLQAGNYFRLNGIPAHDVFTYTAPHFPWIDHEWGSDVLMSYLYHLPHGYVLLAVLFAGIWTAGLAIYAGRARIAILLLATLVMIPYVAIRPTAWDVLGVAIVLKLLQKPTQKALWWLPALFVAWANLHGGFVLGLGLMVYFAVRHKSSRLALLALACTLVTFINPYGPRLYVEIWRTLSDLSLHSQTIGMSTFSLQGPAWLLVALWAAGFIWFDSKKLRNWWKLEPLLLAASLSATRYTVFFAIVSTKALDQYYSRFKIIIRNDWMKIRGRRVLQGLFVVIIALTYVAVTADRITTDREAGLPVKAVAYLKVHPCSGHLFNDFNYGGYLIWKLPSEPVFIDGRMPSWRNPQGVKYMDTYFAVTDNAAYQKTIFTRYNIKCVVMGEAGYSNFIDRLKAQGWQVRVQANGAVLLTSS